MNDKPRTTALENWVFDLDNTLYPASCDIFPQIDLRMRQYIADELKLSLDEAWTLQKRYYHEFGTSLRGLMLRHGVEPSAFLAYVHEIDCSVIEPCDRLQTALKALPGKRFVFTNGSERHALNVLERLGVADLFDGIFDIKAGDYIPKPQPETYQALVRRFAIDPRASAMFEDLHRNLIPAHAIGMTTVWVKDDTHSHWTGPKDDDDLSHVHHVTDDLAGWLAAWKG